MNRLKEHKILAAVLVIALVLGAAVFGANRANADPSGATGLPPGAPALDSCPVVKVGSSGPCVKALQNGLILLRVGLKADGKFGPQTQAAVRAFQGSKNLKVDGIAGRQTFGALRAALVNPTPIPWPTSLVSEARPTGEMGNHVVYKCGLPFGTCSFYIDRVTTRAIAKWLDDNQRQNNALQTAVCTRVGLGAKGGEGKGPLLAGVACEVIVLAYGDEFQQNAHEAATGNGCLQLIMHFDPMFPKGSDDEYGRECVENAA